MVKVKDEEGLDFSHSFDKPAETAVEIEQASITTEPLKHYSKKNLFILGGILIFLILVQLFLLYYSYGSNPKRKTPIPPEGMKIFTK